MVNFAQHSKAASAQRIESCWTQDALMVLILPMTLCNNIIHDVDNKNNPPSNNSDSKDSSHQHDDINNNNVASMTLEIVVSRYVDSQCCIPRGACPVLCCAMQCCAVLSALCGLPCAVCPALCCLPCLCIAVLIHP